MVQFTKQARNSQELIAIYRSRGLEVADQERADFRLTSRDFRVLVEMFA